MYTFRYKNNNIVYYIIYYIIKHLRISLKPYTPVDKITAIPEIAKLEMNKNLEFAGDVIIPEKNFEIA